MTDRVRMLGLLLRLGCLSEIHVGGKVLLVAGPTAQVVATALADLGVACLPSSGLDVGAELSDADGARIPTIALTPQEATELYEDGAL